MRLLRDGTAVAVRPIRATDAAGLARFHDSLSAETVRMRFFSGHPHLSEREAQRFATVDHHQREAFVALTDDEIIAVGRYEMLDNTVDAEVAFVVADSWQGRGLGGILLHELATRARVVGIRRFVAETLAENHRMLAVFTRSGLPTKTSMSQGIVAVTMEL